jgi:ATP-dependent helicase/nuclease subunit A
MFTPEQRAAIDRREGSLLVRAGAGTGKTSVLVERFVRAVVDDGVAVDGVLAITFTEKAAAEMKGRVRARFAELGRREEARAAEGAWISTIHGFCSRVLRAHALTAGIDPDYRVLDQLEAERVGLDAFDRALEDFLADGAEAVRLEMVAAYTPDRLRDMVRTAWSRLRSKGERRPSLPEAEPPRAAEERERLDEALEHALADLGAAGDGATVERELERLERCREALAALAPGALAEPDAIACFALKGNARALRSPACEAYREAHAAYAALCEASRSFRDRALLRDLMGLFGDHYDRLKRSRSGLDFEDLQLVARDLLRDHRGLRQQYSGRFDHVLVDEFQDTNPLQNELLELLARTGEERCRDAVPASTAAILFRVGDEHQSIYGFRHADVEVFREHAARAETVSLTTNFRSRGEVLDAVDLAFEREWGEDFEPLREAPGARAEPPRVAPAVELLVVDKSKPRWDEHFAGDDDPFGRSMRPASPWRACEARLVAKRIDELTSGGGFAHRDVVVLLRATTHMTLYERALEERGVPTHVVGGRGYWSQQQVGDLRHWLAALANPLDELAVYSVLASPLVGASLDAVALVGMWSKRLHRDPWWTVRELAGGDGSDGLADVLPTGCRERILAFVERLSRERRAAPRLSLETLIDRAVTETGYDRRILGLPAGERRMANVRKLMRLAREFEADEGRDLRGFIDFVAERDLVQEREGEAPLEAEELNAVRLMTIHRAKGLEFPVVCVADLGKDGREDYGALRISDDGELGLRLATIGGGRVDTAELERIRQEQKAKGEEEEKRIFYVAATRAMEHLVLSGATDLQKRPEPKPLMEPMRWIARSFCADLPPEGAAGESVDAFEGREVRVRWQRCVPETVEELLPAGDRKPARPEQAVAAPPAIAPLELAAVPAPRALPVSRLSYSGLAGYERCGYRFYVERALRLPEAGSLRIDGEDPGIEAPPETEEPDELPALLRGTLVHELLERLDPGRPRVPGEAEVAALIERHGTTVREADVADLRGLVEAVAGSALRERLARARRVRSELPFAFTLAPDGAGGRTLLVNGVVDVLAEEDDRTLIVDYKSDRLNGTDPAAAGEEKYAIQRLVYALAALRAGARRVEVAHVFLERPDEPAVATFEATDASRLERDLLDLARGVVEGRFEPTDEPHRELCATCPAQPALCRWEPERTLAPS